MFAPSIERSGLLKVPFPEVDFAEDMAWAQKNLLMGHKILYNPRIQVKHSHNRPPQYAFRRQIINSLLVRKGHGAGGRGSIFSGGWETLKE